MTKDEMSKEQLRERRQFVDTLAAAKWSGTSFNENFDQGLWMEPEASMTYENPAMSLRCDYYCADPRVILHLDAADGKTLGLVFRHEARLGPLLDAIVGVQDSISAQNVKEKTEDLLAACPKAFKISRGGDKLTPVVSSRRRR